MIDNKHIVTWDTLQTHARTIARRLLYSQKKWERIIAVSRGGLVPGALLARELAIRYVDTVCISSYDYNIQRKKIDIIKRADGDGDRYIIVDDLVDTGNTAKAIRTLYPKAHFVTLFAKPSGRLFVDDYVVDIPQNTWIEQPWDMGFTFIPPLIRE